MLTSPSPLLYCPPRRSYPAMQALAGAMLTRCPQPTPRVLAELRHRHKARRRWLWALLGGLL